MSRYTGPSCKKCRKAETKLFLKGVKCYSHCVLDRAAPVGGRRGAFKPRVKLSEYAKHLKEKQKARIMAGMNETPFENLFKKASKTRGSTGETLLRFMETRLDNIVRRLGFAVSMKASRQLVCHCHVRVNDRVVNVSSYHVKPGDRISLVPGAAKIMLVKQGLEHAEKRATRSSFLEFDAQTLAGKLLRWPDRGEMSFPVQDQLIVEHYSK
ncbi:MAG: 30S ribosomal protein S4 [bacterium]